MGLAAGLVTRTMGEHVQRIKNVLESFFNKKMESNLNLLRGECHIWDTISSG